MSISMPDRSSNVKKKVAKFSQNHGYSISEFWGDLDMTVCIASKLHDPDLIVLVFDTMLSNPYISSDAMAIKTFNVAATWQTAFAANDITDVMPILNRVKKTLEPYGADFSLETVSDAFSKAFAAQLRQVAERQVLSKFGLDMDSYLRSRTHLGSDIYNRLFYQIEAISLDITFLVFGFDEAGLGHIFTVSNPGDIDDHDIEGFAAIGSGSFTAIATLFGLRHRGNLDLADTLYDLCAAKFASESAQGVGKWTAVGIFKRKGGAMRLVEDDLVNLRNIWSSEGTVKRPQSAAQIALNIIEAERKREKASDSQGNG